MKLHKSLLISAMVAGLLSSGLALADHGYGHSHVGIGFYFGPGPHPYYHPYYGAPYYPYPYPYAYPPVVVAPPQSPPVYIQQDPDAQAPQQSASRQDAYWYHCDKPEGYYPYIKDCPAGWQKVVPEPPKQQ